LICELLPQEIFKNADNHYINITVTQD